jgi:hypothetical protein
MVFVLRFKSKKGLPSALYVFAIRFLLMHIRRIDFDELGDAAFGQPLFPNSVMSKSPGAYSIFRCASNTFAFVFL